MKLVPLKLCSSLEEAEEIAGKLAKNGIKATLKSGDLSEFNPDPFSPQGMMIGAFTKAVVLVGEEDKTKAIDVLRDGKFIYLP